MFVGQAALSQELSTSSLPGEWQELVDEMLETRFPPMLESISVDPESPAEGDEITITAKTHVAELADGLVKTYTLSPEDFGFRPAPMSALCVASVEEAADAIRAVLAGEEGPRRDVVLLNAGAAILVGGAAADFREGIARAAEVIDSGAAEKTLANLVRLSNLPA